MRSTARSRYYIKAPAAGKAENWSDDRFWNELALRPGDEFKRFVTRGLQSKSPSWCSLVSEPMQHGSLLLAGDAAHIVPPTGAKGLNLAASDVAYLAQALTICIVDGGGNPLQGYSGRALARVKAVRFLWWLTSLTHHFPGAGPIDRKMQLAELGHIRT